MGLIDNTIDDTIELNMVPGTRSPRLHCSKYDVGRTCTIKVYNKDEEYDISSYWVTIEGSKSDGTAFAYSVAALGGSVTTNTLTFKLLSQMTNKEGDVLCEVVLYNSETNSRVASLNFILDVEKGPINDTSVDSHTDFASLMDLYSERISKVDAAAERAENAATRAETAADKVLTYSLEGTTLRIKAITTS